MLAEVPALGLLPPGVVRPGAMRLLEAAIVGFAERGYHGVSVRDLAADVGIKAASFYSHFTSKEALLHSLVATAHRAHFQALQAALLDAGTEPRDQLREVMRANVVFQARYPLLTIVANSELHALSDDHRGEVVRLRHDSGLLFASIIERGNRLGAFACEHVWVAMSAIASMGIRVAWWFRDQSTRDDGPLGAYADEAMAWLPEADHNIDAIADAYAEYALLIVHAR